MSLAFVSPTSASDQFSQEVLKKFQWAVKRVTNETKSNADPALSSEELIELIKSWEPKRDIVCLYVRWARQLKRNFNLDSIAALLCLSRQCGYTPINFLRKVKTLSVHKHQQATYGLTFHFDVPNRQEINRERLNKEFLGLSVTLALLQEQVIDSPSVLGKSKMRQKGPRIPYPMKIPMNHEQNQHASVTMHPTTEFHTRDGLLSRIWMSINHRWLALFVTEHLFRDYINPWSYQDALIYLFQMMAPCGPGRYEFLAPLVGYCLRFTTHESIVCKQSQLRLIWSDSSTFFSYGHTCLRQFTTDQRSRIIVSCFQQLRSEIPTNCKRISYNRDCSWNRRWTMLRSYIFQFWLDSACNSSLKSCISAQLSSISDNVRKKKKRVHESPCSTTPVLPKKPNTSVSASTTLPHLHVSASSATISTSSSTPYVPANGLQTILSSRQFSQRTPLFSTSDRPRTEDPVRIHNSITVNTSEHLSAESPIENPLQLVEWSKINFLDPEQMRNHVESFLLIHSCRDGVDILSELSTIEVYSANNLHELSHCRLSGRFPFKVPREKLSAATMYLRNDSAHFIDKATKSYHVAREGSDYFREFGDLLPPLSAIKDLCQAIVTHGSVDSKRAFGQCRMNIGNGGQNWVDGAPSKLHGDKVFNDMDGNGKFDAIKIRQTIGRIVEFTWVVMCALQKEANDHPIASDRTRRQLYSKYLTDFLLIDNEEVAFEDITLVISPLYPSPCSVSEHTDVMNDTLSGYTRTAAFNLVLGSVDDDNVGIIIHLQVLCNFRKVIGFFLVPFHRLIAPVAKHALEYLKRWENSIQSVYAGRSNKKPTIFDRSNMYLDNHLRYEVVTISDEHKHKATIRAEYILTEVGISRTLSMSLFIDPIVRLQRHLKFDQSIELAFASTFLSNPFWFDWTMTTLLGRLVDPSDDFCFGLHPFYDWVWTSYEIFGGWQGGPYNRWSPCGGNKETILETFGAHPESTKVDRIHGEERLSQVVSILFDHVRWINSLIPSGTSPVSDMPLSLVKAQCDKTIHDISVVASCQFSHFRLGLFTTILSGSGLLRPGRHLKNLMYPVKGSASFKHLSRPTPDTMSLEKATALTQNTSNESITNDDDGYVPEEHHDIFMQYLSAELGCYQYVRDEMECILCESHPMRSLNCRDWFRKGMTLYDLNIDGEAFERPYGKESCWTQLPEIQSYEFAYLNCSPAIVFISLDVDLSYYAQCFHQELRSNNAKRVVFKGRTTRTSDCHFHYTNSYTKFDQFVHPSMQLADFVVVSEAVKRNIKSIFVLDNAECAVETGQCNDMDMYQHGMGLYRHLVALLRIDKTSSMGAGSFHMDTDSNNDEITFFPGHIDKSFVHTAWFVPIGCSYFFTLLAVDPSSSHLQDPDSMRVFAEWRETLSPSDSEIVKVFLEEFSKTAKKHMKENDTITLVYLNKRGSVLSFPANRIFHATIVPKKPKGFPRDLFVFHPLDGITSS
jgi:hypothetical protein